MIGRTLAHYRITAALGAGGMGEVYRATDSKLGREVALKMLPPAFAQDAERMARFRREAQILASLNHPNIAAIHGLEETDEGRFLVLELVDGPTLFDRLLAGRIPLSESLDIAVQIADAVEYAHENGVVHRDIKPANVKLTDDGRVKVLDFGLAKALEDPRAVSGGSGASGSPAMITQSPTLQSPITDALTGANVILGTAAYMSPEQARGKVADRRADIWSFGVTLFEMLTGRRLFDGETVSDTIASILKTEPDWSNLPTETPERLRELLQRCLDKDPRRRVRDMGDVRLELEWIRDGKGTVRAAAPEGARRPRIPVLIATAIAGVAIGALAWSAMSRRPPDDDVATTATRLSAVFGEDLDLTGFDLSPDGRSLLVWGRPRDPAPGEEATGLYLRRLDRYETRFIPGSRSVSLACFSPDSRWLAIVAPQEAGSAAQVLWKVPVDGSAPPLKLLPWSPEWQGLHWLPDGDLVTGSRARAIVRVPTDGSPAGAPIPLTAEGFAIESTVSPRNDNASRLPDGHHLLSSIEAWDERGYRQDIVVMDVRTGKVRLVLENGASPLWSDTGHLLFSRGTTVLAVPFDPGKLAVTGGPTALENDLRITASWSHAPFGISTDGTLAYVPGGFVGGERRLVWLDRDFRELAPWSPDRLAIERSLLLSPDGERVATVVAGTDGVYDIWMSDPGRNDLRKWLEEPGQDCVPLAWSPDGDRVAYFVRTERGTRFFLRPVDGGDPLLLLEDTDPATGFWATCLADDGNTLLLTRVQGDRRAVVTVPVLPARDGPGPVKALLEGADGAKLSRDGRWLAYRSNASGRWEVYVRRWLGEGKLGPERRASTDGVSDSFLWWRTSDAGPQICYGNEKVLYSVTLRGDPEPNPSRPVPVAERRPEYEMMAQHPDGRVLMCLLGENEGPFHRVAIVRGWEQELERRLGGVEEAGP